MVKIKYSFTKQKRCLDNNEIADELVFAFVEKRHKSEFIIWQIPYIGEQTKTFCELHTF